MSIEDSINRLTAVIEQLAIATMKATLAHAAPVVTIPTEVHQPDHRVYEDAPVPAKAPAKVRKTAAEKAAEQAGLAAMATASVAAQTGSQDVSAQIAELAQQSAARASAKAAPITFDGLRSRFIGLTEKGMRSKLIALLDSLGCKRLPDLKPDQYATVSAGLDLLESECG